MKKYNIFALIFFILSVIYFFNPVLLKDKLPIPADTIIGLYHPFRDLYAKDYPRGIPFKNFLITDPVRQQYPWRELAFSLEEKFQLPLWNPYSLAGSPLLANFQSAPFYFLNSLYFIFPFSIAWSIQVMLQPLLAGLFLYFFLAHLKIRKIAALLGAIVYAFSGFSIAWMEWNTIGHVAFWLPLILLSIDKTVSSNKYIVFWSVVFIFSLTSSFLAGHLQTFFYLFIVSFCYLFARWIQNGKNKKIIFLFIINYSLFFIITAIQWLPTLQLIEVSARNIDQVGNWQKDGWLIPWQHLIQFIVPDFFGNPTTLNYWGVWNYGEFIGYIGIFPLLLAIFCLFFRRDKKTLFFGSIFFLSLLFSLPTFFAKIPFILDIPFLSTAQPTRLLFITDFSLAILAALGFDYFLRRQREIIYPLGFLTIIFGSLWLFVLYGNEVMLLVNLENLEVARRNLIFPTGIYILVAFLSLSLLYFSKRNQKITMMICTIIVGLTVFDLFRFGLKFTPFTNKEYLFTQTKTISFLQKNQGNFRFMTTDSQILPPNFSVIYRLQSIDGYDPLYLLRYGELIAASERGEPNISPPFGFNRIITPKRYDSKVIDLLGVKYVLSLSDINSPKLKKVFQEGQTRVYENKDVLPRVFFVEEIVWENDKEAIIKKIFSNKMNLLATAIFENPQPAFITQVGNPETPLTVGKAEIVEYIENKVVIKTENKGDGFLVLTDTFYDSWQVAIDGNKSMIYRTDYNFRGVSVPKGKHTVEFSTSLL